jgi:hypothetical protein
LTGAPLRQQADFRNNRGPQVSFERPELSPCVAHVSNRDALKEALEIIRAGGRSLAQRPEADLGEFVPCSLDQWREQKYLARRQEEERRRAAIRAGEKVYDGRGEY